MSLWRCPQCGVGYGNVYTCPACQVATEFVTIPRNEEIAWASVSRAEQLLQEIRDLLVWHFRDDPPPRSLPLCRNCGHVDAHTGPAGDVEDACTHPGCHCGFDSRPAVDAVREDAQ